MLGNSSSVFNSCIQQAVNLTRSQKILELGCGQGKFDELLQRGGYAASLTGIQRIFSTDDTAFLQKYVAHKNMWRRIRRPAWTQAVKQIYAT